MLKLQRKMTLAFLAVFTVITLIITAVTLASFREFSVRSATEHTRTAAEIVLVSLTESMINGTIHKREALLERLSEINGLDEIRVSRSNYVTLQFGEGIDLESNPDDIDALVMLSGRPDYRLTQGILSTEFRATIPYIASSSGSVNCMACHNAPEGSVLGTIALQSSIAHLRKDALLTVSVIISALLLLALASISFLNRIISPLAKTAREIEDAVDGATHGDFSIRITPRTQDEIGEIATQFNKLSESVSKKLCEIRSNVAELVKSHPENKGDLLADTAATVHGLVKVSRFKQAIEEDDSADEVFHRASHVMNREFGIELYSIYEVNRQKNRIETIIIDGAPAESPTWCSECISENASMCRAVRTGHAINGLRDETLCRSFSSEHLEKGYRYLCLPIIQSGSAGSILQIVVHENEMKPIIQARPLIESYLREAAPVLQAKRLMADLKENSLRCAMTGLHNRRFLEEYADTLIAQMRRKQSPMSLVMMDLDYFKQVNDTHGHDIGDHVLKDLAKILQENVRSSDLVIRYGGEEFLVVLLDADSEKAFMVADKIRIAVEKHTFKTPAGALNKTISAGVADFPNDADAFWQVLKFADVSLYAAKEGGRNKVVRFTNDLWDSKESY